MSHFSLLSFPINATDLVKLDVARIVLERVGVKIAKTADQGISQGGKLFSKSSPLYCKVAISFSVQENKGKVWMI